MAIVCLETNLDESVAASHTMRPPPDVRRAADHLQQVHAHIHTQAHTHTHTLQNSQGVNIQHPSPFCS